MLLLNSIKTLFLCFFVLTLFSACNFQQNSEGEKPAPTLFGIEESKNDTPFSTKEPENFQAEFVVTTNGKSDETFAARNGGKRRFDYNSGEKNQFSVVQNDDGKSFLIFNDKKIYAESSLDSGVSSAENPFDFLTTELLNQKTDVKFEKLATENGLTKYGAVLGEKGKSEVLIWIDEKIGLPVKQEFYSKDGERKTLNFTFEMKNFKPQTDENLFEIPKDFKKVSIEEFQARLRSEF